MNAPPHTRSEAPRAARYEPLLRVLRLLTAQRDPKALFRVLTGDLRHLVEFDGISIVLYDEAAHRGQQQPRREFGTSRSPARHLGERSASHAV
jgi:hypothetical protein